MSERQRGETVRPPEPTDAPKKIWTWRPSHVAAKADPLIAGFFERLSAVCASLALFLAGLGIAGWLAGIPILQSGIVGRASMVPATATLLILVCFAHFAIRRQRRNLGRGLCGIVIVTSILRLQELWGGRDLLPAALVDAGAHGTLSPLTALCLLLVGTAELSASRREAATAWTAQFLSLLVGLLAGWNLLSYFYGAVWDTRVPYTNMAPSTSLALVLLALATSTSRPYTGLMVLLTTRSLGGAVARRLMLPTLLFPLVTGWVALLAQSAGVADVTAASTAFVCFTVLFFAAVVWLTSVQIHRLSLEREQIREDLVALRHQAEVREHFVAMLTHDLRSPLAAAKLGADLILRYPERRDALERHVHRIVANIERADKMIRDLLDVSRLRAGETLALDRRDCELPGLVRTVADRMTFLYTDLKLELHCEGAVTGRWSCEGVERILENLVTNAYKYGDRARPVSLAAHDLGERVRICVHNWGNPIAPDKIKSLFLPFRRDEATALDRPGWGLGLALVRGLTEAHGGSVVAESNSERGTSFCVTLPKR